MSHDILVVGAGFAGATMARQYADAGADVLVIDKRDHIGGNAYDYVNEHGVRIHKYGPHIFHTNSDKVLSFLSRFTDWLPYEHRVRASVDGMLVPFPINIDTVNQVFGLDLDEAGMRAFIAAEVAASWEEGREVMTAEDQCLATVGRRLYEMFFKGYTTKMWGRAPSELDKSVTARIPLRFTHDDRYFTDTHQVMPKDGYTAMFARMLDHPGIEIRLKTRPVSVARAGAQPERIVYTGAVDAFFRFRLGRLPYRSVSLSLHQRVPGPTVACAATTNFPGVEHHTRETEWAVVQGLDAPPHPFSVFTREHPTDSGEPYYPIPSPESAALYKRYEALADKTPNVVFVGRLATYRYMNMDQVVAQALAAFTKRERAQPRTP